MNKLGRSLQKDAIYQIWKLRAFQFQIRRILKFAFFVPMFNMWPPGRGQFWLEGHHMNKLGRGPQGDAVYQISKVYTFQFQRRIILKMGFFVPIFQLVTPQGGASFNSNGIIWTYMYLVEVHKEMLNTKYQSSRPSSFREEKFWNFLSLFLWPPRVGPILTSGASHE